MSCSDNRPGFGEVEESAEISTAVRAKVPPWGQEVWIQNVPSRPIISALRAPATSAATGLARATKLSFHCSRAWWVFGQGSVGQGVVVQVVGETEGQFGGGVEIQQVVLAGALLHQALAGLADVLHQFRLVGLDAFGQARGVGVGGRPFANRREQPGKLPRQGARTSRTFCAPRPRRRSSRRWRPWKRLVMTMNSLFRRISRPLRRRMCGSSSSGAAQVFQAHGLGDEARAELAEALAVEAALQAFGGEPGEVAEAPVECVAQGGAAGLRQEDGADGTGAEDAQGYFQDRHSAAMKAPSGCAVAGIPIMVAV